MMMLEARLILNVTVLASEPLDDFSNGHAVEHGMRGPEPLTSPPTRYDGTASFKRLLTPENNLVLVTSFDIVSIHALSGFGHDFDFLLPRFQNSTIVSAALQMLPDKMKYIRTETLLQSSELFRHQNASVPSTVEKIIYLYDCFCPLLLPTESP
jgi:hypothetical protein